MTYRTPLELEMGEPWIDPDEIRRSVEHPIGRSRARIEDRKHELNEHVTDGARARLAGLGGDQRARYARGEELLVRRRPLFRADEIPPARPLVFPEPTLLARSEDLPQARAEERQIVGREVGDWSERHENIAQDRAGVVRPVRKDRRNDKSLLPILRESHPCRRREVIRHPASVERRRAAHGVHDMFVEAREEAEPMLSGHAVVDRARGAFGKLMSTRVLTFLDHGDATRLPSGEVVAFEHNDLEAALDQFVRGAHPGDAAAQYDNPSPWVTGAISSGS